MSNKGFFLWFYICLAGLLALLIIQTYRQRESKGGFSCQQLDLAFMSRGIEPMTCKVSKDLTEYLGWVIIYPDGIRHITDTFGGYKKTVMFRGDPFTIKPRKAILVFVKQESLKWMKKPN